MFCLRNYNWYKNSDLISDDDDDDDEEEKVEDEVSNMKLLYVADRSL